MTTDATHPRICLLTEAFFPWVGGGETHALSLCREWVRNGIRVFVLTRRILASYERREELDGLKVVRVGPVGAHRLGKYLMILPALLELVRKRKEYDLIYVCGFRVAGVPAMLASRLLGKPCVLRAEACGELSGGFIWQSPDEAVRRVRLKPAVRLYLWLRNRLLLKASGFLSISREISDEFSAAGVPPERIHLIPNGIDTTLYVPATAARRGELRAQFGLPAEAVIFAYSGKLNKGKGLEMLVRVFSRLAGGNPKAHLLLIGSGGQQFLSCEAALKDFVRASVIERQVTFTGFQTRVHEYLQAADGFVFPSESESFGLALVEAMACELPSFASRIGGILDIVDDGRNGRLIDARDDALWLAAMRDFTADPARTAAQGRRGRETVIERFGIARVAERHLDLFRSLVARADEGGAAR